MLSLSLEAGGSKKLLIALALVGGWIKVPLAQLVEKG